MDTNRFQPYLTSFLLLWFLSRCTCSVLRVSNLAFDDVSTSYSGKGLAERVRRTPVSGNNTQAMTTLSSFPLGFDSTTRDGYRLEDKYKTNLSDNNDASTRNTVRVETGETSATTTTSLPMQPIRTPSNGCKKTTPETQSPKFSNLLTKDIEDQLLSQRALDFIGNLTTDFQRDVVLTNLRTCPFIPLCHFRLDLEVGNYDEKIMFEVQCCNHCNCNKERCVSGGNCCPDTEWFARKPTALPAGIQQNWLPTQIRDDFRTSTVKGIIGCPMGAEPKMVSKCVRNSTAAMAADDDIIALEDVTLVTDRTSNTTYKNVYCAKCNNIDPTSLLPWTAILDCPEKLYVDLMPKDSPSSLLKKNDNCRIVFQKPEAFKHNEFGSIQHEYAISRCNVTGLWTTFSPDIEMACGLYRSTIIVESEGNEDMYFRNVFCARCNGFNPSPLDTCEGRTDFNEIDGDFSRLFRVVKEDLDFDVYELSYDHIKGKLRPLVCNTGREPRLGTCPSILDVEEEFDLDVVVRIRPHEEIPLRLGYLIVPVVKTAVMEKLNSVLSDFDLCGVQSYLKSNVRLDNAEELKQQISESFLGFYEMRLQIHLKAHADAAYESLASLSDSNITVVPNIQDKEHGTQHSFELKLNQDSSTTRKTFDYIASIGHYSLTDTVGHGADVIDINDVIDYIMLIDEVDGTVRFPYLHWNDASTQCKLTKPLRDVFSLRPCQQFRIPWSEFNWKVNLDGLTIPGTSVQLDISDFSIEVDESFSTHVLICIDTYYDQLKSLQLSTVHQQDKVQLAKNIISIACVSVSIICLAASLCTFCLFKQLQTIPGKNNIALMTSLILADSFFLIGVGVFDKDTPVCKAIGLLTHFFLLMSISWMNACTFHMCRVLLRTRHISSGMGSRKHLYYHIYCTLMSILFVLINIVVSMLESNQTDMGYGKVMCFVSTQMMNDLTFGVPSSLVAVANFGMFLAIVIKLKGRPSIQKSVKNERNYFLMFTKLSTVTGITWVFGFVYRWTEIDAFSFLFTIFNASQGVFIMLAFVCNRRTVTLYKERFFGSTNASNASTGNSSVKTSSTRT